MSLSQVGQVAFAWRSLEFCICPIWKDLKIEKTRGQR